jgi:hypothetical protein
MIPADVHQPDEAALRAVCNHKCAGRPVVVRLTGNLPPGLSIRRRLNEPRLHMMTTRATISVNCIMCWHKPPLLEIITDPFVRRVRNIFLLPATSRTVTGVTIQISNLLWIIRNFRCGLLE